MYAEVIIPLALPKNYTWSVPGQWRMSIREGCRVEVQLKNKKYAGIVKRLHQNKPESFEPKDILNLLDQDPILHPAQLQLWEWVEVIISAAKERSWRLPCLPILS